MTNTNITNLRKHLFDYINQTIDYNGLLETLYFSGNSTVHKEITDGMQTPLSECISKAAVIGLY